MKPAAARAHIRQLCCLGPGAPAIVPDLLKALAAVIPSGPNVFTEIKPGFEPGYSIFENPIPDILDLYAQERNGAFRWEMDVRTEWLRRHPGTVYWQHEQAILGNFYRCGLYNEIWRPMDQHHLLEGLVREGGRPLGMIQLFRGAGEGLFNGREAAELARLLPYIAHGLTARPAEDPDFVDSGHSGHAVLDAAGRITHQSEAAGTLLYLAADPQFGSAGPPGLPLADQLRKLAGDLSALAQGKEAPPPVARRQNPWGRFVFRAYRLDAAADGAQGLTLLTVEHQEPRSLRLLRGLRNSPLSAREREICFWLARGLSQAEAARRLQIRPGTAKKYADAAYLKLGAHARAELLEKIMSGATQA